MLVITDSFALSFTTLCFFQGEPLYVGANKIGECKFDIPEGHRFATIPILKDQQLLSWGIPFGLAERDIAQGNVHIFPFATIQYVHVNRSS